MKLRCVANCWVVLLGLGAVWAQNASVANTAKKEDIYILRSVRTSRISPTNYCVQSRTGFSDALYESRFVFHSVTADSSDGMVSAFGQRIGAAQACFGRTVTPDVLTFYAEGDIAGQRFTGKGKCTTLKSGFPEPGLNVVTCFLELGGLKHPYLGGLLTSNTIFSQTLTGETSDPPGYVHFLPFPDYSPFTYPWNITGQPAASVPCGFTQEGLPVGLQIVGRRFADATVLRAAAAFEEVRPWNNKRPSL